MKKSLIIVLMLSGIGLAVLAATTLFTGKAECSNSGFKEMENQMTGEIKLPEASLKGTMSVEEALKKRRSVRSYADKTLSLEQLSQLLWATYGVTSNAWGRSLKTAPSAGATYPLEIYLLAGNIKELAPGLYRYSPDNNSLKLEKRGDMRKNIMEAALKQGMLQDAPATVIFSAVFERTTARYGKRGEERYVYMDMGHSAQNLYLQATAMGLGTCAIGAFDDKAMQEVLQLPENEKILYLMPVGYEN